MIQKLQKIFHTDKWWGQITLCFLFNLFFLLSFYLMSDLFYYINDKIIKIPERLFIILYLLLVVPILSSLLVLWFKNKIQRNLSNIKVVLFNLLTIMMIYFLLFLVILNSIKPSFF